MRSRDFFAIFFILSITLFSAQASALQLTKQLSPSLNGYIIKAQAGFKISYIIEIGLWRKKEAAIEEFQTLQANHPALKKYQPIIEMMDYTHWNRGIAYRLRIGHMRSKEAAEQVCDSMRQDGYQKKCLVVFMPN